MLYGEKSLDDARQYLQNKITKINNLERRNICRECFEKFNIPLESTADMLNGKRDPLEYKVLELFGFIYVINRNELSKFFTEEEIDYLSSSKLEDNKLSLPISFDVIQITEDQWIGRIDTKQIIALRDAQMLNYKENSQRTLKRIVSGGIEVFRIAVNKKSVKAIAEAFRRGIYIPDDITLNMPLGESDYTYDAKNHILTVTNLPNGRFDLLDGEHRYLGMSSVANFDENFNYPMEIRIVSFPIEKAQRFIYQKDQKTQMKKLDSASFDPFSASNRITSLVNEDPRCFVHGMIGRNGEPISFPIFSMCLKKYFVPSDLKPAEENRFIITQKARIVEKLNKLVEQNPDLLENKDWGARLISAMLYVFSKDVKNDDMGNLVDEMIKRTASLGSNVFTARNTVQKRVINIYNKIMEDYGYV